MITLDISVLSLPGDDNYAILSPYLLTFALNANKDQLDNIKSEVIIESNEIIGEINNKNKDENNIIYLGIIPTFDCNLQCIYCYSKGGDTKEVIDFNVVQTVINYLEEKYQKSHCLELQLVGGGEPLFYFDTVVQIVNFAKSKFNEVNINVVTNGTFNQTVLDWLIKEKVSIRVSFDSVGQDEQRPFRDKSLSGRLVERNIKELIRRGNPPMIQCIITSKTIDKMKKIIDNAVDIGIDVIKFEPSNCNEISRGKSTDIDPDPIIYANKLIEAIEYISNNNLPILIDTGYFSQPSNGYYCGINQNNFILTPEGMITSCVEVARKKDPYSDYIMLGEVNNKGIRFYDNDFLTNLHFSNQLGGCFKCNLRMICLGGCPMTNIWENGVPVKKSEYTCKLQHEFLPKLLYKIAVDPNFMNVIMENTERKEIYKEV